MASNVQWAGPIPTGPFLSLDQGPLKLAPVHGPPPPSSVPLADPRAGINLIKLKNHQTNHETNPPPANLPPPCQTNQPRIQEGRERGRRSRSRGCRPRWTSPWQPAPFPSSPCQPAPPTSSSAAGRSPGVSRPFASPPATHDPPRVPGEFS